jgi:hypothetical protein
MSARSLLYKREISWEGVRHFLALWIRKRLEGFPLRPLRPRYPWELPARRRPPTRHDEEDRFR